MRRPCVEPSTCPGLVEPSATAASASPSSDHNLVTDLLLSTIVGEMQEVISGAELRL